jgi:hypothetical protein
MPALSSLWRLRKIQKRQPPALRTAMRFGFFLHRSRWLAWHG